MKPVRGFVATTFRTLFCSCLVLLLRPETGNSQDPDLQKILQGEEQLDNLFDGVEADLFEALVPNQIEQKPEEPAIEPGDQAATDEGNPDVQGEVDDTELAMRWNDFKNEMDQRLKKLEKIADPSDDGYKAIAKQWQNEFQENHQKLEVQKATFQSNQIDDAIRDLYRRQLIIIGAWDSMGSSSNDPFGRSTGARQWIRDLSEMRREISAMENDLRASPRLVKECREYLSEFAKARLKLMQGVGNFGQPGQGGPFEGPLDPLADLYAASVERFFFPILTKGAPTFAQRAWPRFVAKSATLFNWNGMKNDFGSRRIARVETGSTPIQSTPKSSDASTNTILNLRYPIMTDDS